jgi:hypothetical protein
MVSRSQSPQALLARLGIAAPAFWRGGLALLEDMLDRVLGLAACGQDERPRAI